MGGRGLLGETCERDLDFSLRQRKTSTHQIVIVAVSRDRKSRTALCANEIIGFVLVTLWEKKIKPHIHD